MLFKWFFPRNVIKLFLKLPQADREDFFWFLSHKLSSTVNQICPRLVGARITRKQLDLESGPSRREVKSTYRGHWNHWKSWTCFENQGGE